MGKTQDAIKKMRRQRGWCHLTTAAQLLYYELVMINNYNGWENEFSCSNEYLCRCLNMSERTLKKVRQTLIDVNLIHYTSGKKRKQAGRYSLCDNSVSKPDSEQEQEKKPEREQEREQEKEQDNNNINSTIKLSNNDNRDIDGEIKEKTTPEQQFRQFHQLYPGVKLSFRTEFANLQEKHPGYEELIPLFIPAIKKQIRWTSHREEMGLFAPCYPALKTWINERRWETELPKQTYS